MRNKTLKLKDIQTADLIRTYMNFRKPNSGPITVWFDRTKEPLTITEPQLRKELNSRNLKFGDIADYLNVSAIQIK